MFQAKMHRFTQLAITIQNNLCIMLNMNQLQRADKLCPQNVNFVELQETEQFSRSHFSSWSSPRRKSSFQYF